MYLQMHEMSSWLSKNNVRFDINKKYIQAYVEYSYALINNTDNMETHSDNNTLFLIHSMMINCLLICVCSTSQINMLCVIIYFHSLRIKPSSPAIFQSQILPQHPFLCFLEIQNEKLLKETIEAKISRLWVQTMIFIIVLENILRSRQILRRQNF